MGNRTFTPDGLSSLCSCPGALRIVNFDLKKKKIKIKEKRKKLAMGYIYDGLYRAIEGIIKYLRIIGSHM